MARKNIAVVGCGRWGRNHVRNFHALGALGVVCDASPAGRSLAGEIVPDVPVRDEISDVLDDPSIEGVVIATPSETHAALCEAALIAGKDVLCEKPLALRYEEAVHLGGLAADRSRILMVGHILEYHPAILKLRSLVVENMLGKVRYIYSNRLNLGRIRREENILWSFAPHDVAVILRLMGTLPFQVSAAVGAYITPNIADVTVTQLLFDNGAAAHIFVSWLNPFKEQKLVVVGTERMATFDDVAKELILHDQRVDLNEGEPVPVRGKGTRIEFDPDEPLRVECRAFLDAVATRVQPLTGAGSALGVLRVLHAAQRSLVTQGHPVQLPME